MKATMYAIKRGNEFWEKRDPLFEKERWTSNPAIATTFVTREDAAKIARLVGGEVTDYHPPSACCSRCGRPFIYCGCGG